MSGLDREFDSLFRSQVRELESESLNKTPVRKRAITREQTPLREVTVSTPARFVREQRPMREDKPLREQESEATPLRALPQFKRSLVESRRAMRAAQRVASPSLAVALSTRIPMTVLVATSA